jgi:hypothetical protein
MSVQVPNHLTTFPPPSRIGAPRLEPAVLPVAAADPVFHVVRVAARHGLQPELPRRRAVVRVQRLQPAPPQQVRLRDAGVLGPLGAEIVAGAVGRRGPDELRQRLRLLRPPPLGDVAEDQDDAREAAAVVDDGGAAVVDGNRAAVPGQQRRVVGQPDDRARAEYLGRGVLGRLAGLLVDEAEHLGQRPPDGVAQRPARQRLGRRIQEGHPGLGVGREDGVAEARQRDRVAALAGRGAAVRAVQGFTQAADDHPGQREERQGGGGGARDVGGVVRSDEDVIRDQGGEEGGQEPGPEAAVVRRDHDGREEEHGRDRVPEYRPEERADQKRDRYGQQAHAVGNQSGAGCLAHADPSEKRKDERLLMSDSSFIPGLPARQTEPRPRQ